MTQLKYGRRPPKNHPAIEFGAIRSKLPVIPASEDWLGQSGWNMLGNDRYGDCVAVTGANIRRIMTGGVKYPDLSSCETFYKTQNADFPSQDDGMDIQTALETLVANPGKYFDGMEVLGFAKVDHANMSEVKAAIAIFGFVWTGINVQNKNMDDFNSNQPWDYRSSDSTDGGHSVVTGGYGPPGLGANRLSGDERFITWAEETSFTDAFWRNQVEEAWVVICREHLTTKGFLQGVDQVKLAASYKELTGRDFPVQPPTPAPTPVVVGDEDHELAAAMVEWEQHEDQMKTMRSCDKTLETANRKWREAKGL